MTRKTYNLILLITLCSVFATDSAWASAVRYGTGNPDLVEGGVTVGNGNSFRRFDSLVSVLSADQEEILGFREALVEESFSVDVCRAIHLLIGRDVEKLFQDKDDDTLRSNPRSEGDAQQFCTSDSLRIVDSISLGGRLAPQPMLLASSDKKIYIKKDFAEFYLLQARYSASFVDGLRAAILKSLDIDDSAADLEISDR